ncbi:MAG TPA: TetR/AcrR family transcriptional regulator C-terminal domain-containing protein [Acidimicrobiales bacterium]
MPRPKSLTPVAVAAAALAVVERGGLEALSMRAVAAELGMGAMSLYRYVEGREQLEDLVVDLVLEAVDTDVSAGPWEARVAELAQRAWAAITAHPAVVPLLLTRRHTTEASVRWGEAVLAALADGGFAGTERAIAFRTVLSYVVGAVQVEHFGPLSGAGTEALAALPRDRFPVLADTAAHARAIPPDQEFRRGLAVVLRGLADVEFPGDDKNVSQGRREIPAGP